MLCCQPLPSLFLTSSGAMANENALKLVFANKAPADRLLAFEHAFAGRTVALASVTDNPAYRRGVPTALKVDYVPFYDDADPDGMARKMKTSATCSTIGNHVPVLDRYRGGLVQSMDRDGHGRQASAI